ncbi:hypothetical protein [Lachnospira multipara]|uniref:hypothetical protein n=1 Tax=Lachnospira multipara TaxID=28051 RepID=UPI0004E10DB9|nr:hypothetical protein [Lachnospira multipara]
MFFDDENLIGAGYDLDHDGEIDPNERSFAHEDFEKEWNKMWRHNYYYSDDEDEESLSDSLEDEDEEEYSVSTGNPSLNLGRGAKSNEPDSNNTPLNNKLKLLNAVLERKKISKEDWDLKDDEDKCRFLRAAGLNPALYDIIYPLDDAIYKNNYTWTDWDSYFSDNDKCKIIRKEHLDPADYNIQTDLDTFLYSHDSSWKVWDNQTFDERDEWLKGFNLSIYDFDTD